MRLVGPFELTDAEFAGMEILWRKDERQLRDMARRAALVAYRLILKSGDRVAVFAALEAVQSAFSDQNRSQSIRRNRARLDTGESGETADVEAKSEIVSKSL